MKICSSCKKEGHNKNNSLCITNVIMEKFDNMYLFTQTYYYYSLSLQYLLDRYKNKFCYLEWEQVRWINKKLVGFENLISIYSCNLPYVYVKLNIREGKESHANYLLFETKTRILTRYEPHGISYLNNELDEALSFYSKLYNYVYVNPLFSCPYIGMQTVADDKIGMCQTVVLYSLIKILDPSYKGWTPKVLLTKNDKILAQKEIRKIASFFLTNIYFILPEDLRPGFLLFNNTSEFIKSSIFNFLDTKILL